MFHGLISLLTVAAMLVHSFGSCCAQHAGVDCAGADHSARNHASRKSSCRHAHHADVEDGPRQGHKPHPPHAPNHGGRCQFVATAKASVPIGDVLLSFDVAQSGAVHHDFDVRLAAERSSRLSNAGLPPDRHIRDVTQVWLL